MALAIVMMLFVEVMPISPNVGGYVKDGLHLAKRWSSAEIFDLKAADTGLRRMFPSPDVLEAMIIDRGFSVAVSNRGALLGTTVRDPVLIDIFFGSGAALKPHIIRDDAAYFPIYRSGAATHVLFFKTPAGLSEQEYSRYMTAAVGSVVMLLVGFAVLFYHLVTRKARIREISGAMSDALSGNFTRMPASPGDEDFSAMVESFNGIIGKLERQVRDYEQFNEELKAINHEKEVYALEVGRFNEKLREEISRATRDLEAANRELDRKFKELARLEAFNETILTSVPSGILTTDLGGSLTYLNSAAADCLEIAMAVNGAVPDLADAASIEDAMPGFPEVARYVRQVLETDRDPRDFEIARGRLIMSLKASRLRARSGDTVGAVCIVRDITETRRLMLEAQRNSNLASLGQLAAGVAHEIRNPLGAISGFAELIGRNMSDDDPKKKYSHRILDEVNHLDGLVNSVLDLARPMTPSLDYVDLSKILDEALEVAISQKGIEGIKIDRRASRHTPLVLADRAQIRQVLVNILINAFEAMEGKGTLTVRSRHVKEDREVAVQITDTGPGMDSETLDRIFNPFFTTKDMGTGLGLSVCHKIVEVHEGKLEVESSPGNGATFTLSLKAVAA